MKPRATFEKRRKEQLRQERQRAKAESREKRKEKSAQLPRTADGADPDIAHIVAGPQPIPES